MPFVFCRGGRKKITRKSCMYMLIDGDVCIGFRSLSPVTHTHTHTTGKHRVTSAVEGGKWPEHIVLLLKDKSTCMGKEQRVSGRVI